MKVAMKLSNIKGLLGQDFNGTLEKLSAAGYQWVETSDYFGLPVNDLKSRLQASGIRVIAHSAIGQEVLSRIDHLADEVEGLGAKWIHVRHFYIDTYGDGWDVAGRRFRDSADKLAEHGLSLAYHNGQNEFKKGTDGGYNLTALLEAGGERLISNFDVHFCAKAGHDPAEWISRLGPKCRSLEISDMNGPPQPARGKGKVNWKSVVEAAVEQDVEFAVVNLTDCTQEPIDCFKSSRDQLVALGAEG